LPQFLHDGQIYCEVRRAVGERDAFTQSRVGVDHGGRDVLIVVLQAHFEIPERFVDLRLFQEYFRRTTPDHHQTICAGRLLEVEDVGAYLLRKAHFVARSLYIWAVQSLDVVLVEDRGQRFDTLKARLHLVQERLLKNAGFARCFVHIVFKEVPTGKNQVLQFDERHKL